MVRTDGRGTRATGETAARGASGQGIAGGDGPGAGSPDPEARPPGRATAPPSPARETRALGTKAGFWAYRFIGMFGLFILMLGRVWSAFVPLGSG